MRQKQEGAPVQSCTEEEAAPSHAPQAAEGPGGKRGSVRILRGRVPRRRARARSGCFARTSRAAPSVRRLAREIGVDVSQVAGTGPGGRITQDDVKEFSKRVMNSIGISGQAAAASGAARPNVAGPALPDFAKWGEVERKAMSGIRRKTAEHLSKAGTRFRMSPSRQGRHHGTRAGAQK